MRVLFLAFGGYRKKAVVEECAQVLADGGTATVLVDSTGPWRRAGLPDGVTVVDTAALRRELRTMRLEHLVVYRGPRFVLRRVAGRRAKRAMAVHQKVADKFHRRVVMPVHRRLSAESRGRLIARRLGRTAERYDWIIVGDSPSMPDAVDLLDALGDTAPGVAYSVDHLPRAEGHLPPAVVTA
jgi:hypothetical protein